MPASYRNLIDGRWGAPGDAVPDVNPSDLDDVVGVAPSSGAATTEEAIAAAAAAAPGWGDSTPEARANVLDGAAQAVRARQDELGTLLAREEGKPIAEATAEVGRAAHLLRFFAGESLRIGGEVVPSVRPGMTVEMTREPVGVVGVITPWNFPIAIPTWKIAPALAWGNTVVLKPAENTPGIASALVEILHEAGLPAGVLNLVYGRGSVVGRALVDSPDVDAITFTGSVAVGRGVIASAAANGKRVQAEMGGKNPMVVLDDADLELAVEACANGAYFSTGQRCTASSRLIVTEGIHDLFVERLTARMRGMRVGHALETETVVGPVVDEAQLAQDLRYLSIAAEEGGTVIGGELVERPTRGHFLAPALVVGTTNEMTVNREEVFGPVASVLRVRDYDEALAVANATEFGLSAGICTRSLAAAKHFSRRAQAGMVMVNAPTAGVDYHVPFGGSKGSSYGPKEQGSYAREFFSSVKTTYVNPGPM
ncbi:aldehyde dehydrogenase (NAD+) [Rathayibacter oskolensis]|uniref:Aldehyde dehydrogenase (NAD+) n=1 Tax=Rathayibacter oskolensis TaxID=1891671 RepID=A0A1X7PEJ8_9MICO|nr:aldehyde dehydrogenase family protein [Rathayibacter oskolensis]SMH48857.1 aldehyde dehydrogenase (NAD+) [Rathayibacter oskolensis]